MYRGRFDELFTDVLFSGVLCVVQVDMAWGGNVVVSGCFGAQCFVQKVSP